ncbi:MAG TPA: hypothetical protein V6D25_30585 [Leptolyngbyaceae cyanobacterium]
MFSDEDIRKAIDDFKSNQEEGLLIEPFELKSLTPVGYDIRVGIEAFSKKKRKVILIEKDGKINIEPNEIVVIRTLENITLSKKVSATIHSIVSQTIDNNLSNISTTIDPGYSGTLLIQISNLHNSSVQLNFKEPLCTICFYNVNSPSKVNRGTENDRDDIWRRLIREARSEQERLEKEEKLREDERRRKYIFNASLLILIGVISSAFVFRVYANNPPFANFIVAMLTFIVPIIYDIIFKRQSK